MRKIIRNIIAYFGYDFIKIPKKHLVKKDYLLKIGNYHLSISSKNPLVGTYKKQEDFATEIKIITEAVYNKYPEAYFIDVGANVGDTLLRIKSVNADIKTICIEGDAFSFSYLKKNSSQFKNIYLYNNFLGEYEQSLSVNVDKVGWNNTIIPAGDGNEIIKFITLDSIINKDFSGSSAIKFIKIDTEGFDTIILRGANNLLTKYKPIIYFEYNRDNMSQIKEDGLKTLLNLINYGYYKAIFFDDRGRYILNTLLSDTALITQLHNYADGSNGLIYYFNICLIHVDDNDIAEKLISNFTPHA